MRYTLCIIWQRIIIVPLSFIGLLSPVSTEAQQFRIGFLAGLATSQVDGDTYAGYDKAGLMAGGFVTRRLSATGKWSASFEIMYIQKGSRKIPHPDKGDFTSYSLRLDYAEVPLLLKYRIAVPDSASGTKTRLEIEGGIAVGALVRSEEYDSFGAVAGGTPFQKTDYSTVLGVNYPFSEHFSASVRTEYSIVPVRKGGTSSYYQNWTQRFLRPGYYNNLILLSLRYQF